MQTILGSGGAIGSELARILVSYTDRIRLVSRNPKRVNTTDELFPANLMDSSLVREAVRGADVAYLTVGLQYSLKTWRTQWPQLMRHVLEACIQHGTKLVVVDNVYMYDPDYLGKMTEETPVRPVSEKGKIRQQLNEMLFAEMRQGHLTALIARAADFYGPGISSSLLQETVYKNLLRGRRALWFGDDSRLHTFTYTPDAAKATALLGNTPGAFNQVWHLPTDRTPLTGREWVGLFAAALHRRPRHSVLPVWMMRLTGLVVPTVREFVEMAYQFERDYVFDSSKFETSFGIMPTPPTDAVRSIVAAGTERV